MLEEKQYSRIQVYEIASAMLARSISPLLGARMVMAYLHALRNEVDSEIFRLFQGVDSEIDGLPIGPERRYWAPDALQGKDELANKYELQIGDRLLKAAEQLILQFSKSNSS
jgi:hypothetical protein